MTEIMRPLSAEDCEEIFDKIVVRRGKFKEDFFTSLAVVLLNAGNERTRVVCSNPLCKWEGTKMHLEPTEGIPKCPHGHPLFELGGAWKLAWVKELPREESNAPSDPE